MQNIEVLGKCIKHQVNDGAPAILRDLSKPTRSGFNFSRKTQAEMLLVLAEQPRPCVLAAQEFRRVAPLLGSSAFQAEKRSRHPLRCPAGRTTRQLCSLPPLGTILVPRRARAHAGGGESLLPSWGPKGPTVSPHCTASRAHVFKPTCGWQCGGIPYPPCQPFSLLPLLCPTDPAEAHAQGDWPTQVAWLQRNNKDWEIKTNPSWRPSPSMWHGAPPPELQALPGRGGQVTRVPSTQSHGPRWIRSCVL